MCTSIYNSVVCKLIHRHMNFDSPVAIHRLAVGIDRYSPTSEENKQAAVEDLYIETNGNRSSWLVLFFASYAVYNKDSRSNMLRFGSIFTF